MEKYECFFKDGCWWVKCPESNHYFYTWKRLFKRESKVLYKVMSSDPGEIGKIKSIIRKIEESRELNEQAKRLQEELFKAEERQRDLEGRERKLRAKNWKGPLGGRKIEREMAKNRKDQRENKAKLGELANQAQTAVNNTRYLEEHIHSESTSWRLLC